MVIVTIMITMIVATEWIVPIVDVQRIHPTGGHRIDGIIAIDIVQATWMQPAAVKREPIIVEQIIDLISACRRWSSLLRLSVADILAADGSTFVRQRPQYMPRGI